MRKEILLSLSALWGLFPAFLSSGCRKGPFPGDPLDTARRVSREDAPSLLMDSRLTSLQRARVAAVLAGRFKAGCVPWIGRALAAFPPALWPDRSQAVRALRAAGKDPGALELLLRCLVEEPGEDARVEAVRALEVFLPAGRVRKALLDASLGDPGPRVREAALEALGK